MENRIYELWKLFNPTSAFSQGLEEYAGKLFIPTDENKKEVLEKVKELRKEVKTELEKKFLDYIECDLAFEEPQLCPSEILWSFFDHISKEGINTPHLTKLADNSIKLIEAYISVGYDWPIEIRVLTYRGCKGLLGILKSIRQEVSEEKLIHALERLEKKVREYARHFVVKGLDKCDFSEIYPILKKSGGKLDRSSVYPRLLHELYDYPERADEIERKATRWLDDELPMLRKVTKELSQVYGVENNVELVAKELSERSGVAKKDVVKFVLKLRNKLRKVMEKNLVRIAPAYVTKVMETPEYLLPFLPTAAMSPYDTLTNKPFNIFFVTTDEKRSPPTGMADIFQVLTHEEYGHCVNFINSAVSFAWRPNLLERVSTPFHYPISEGISFNREVESLKLLKRMIGKRTLPKEEKELLEFIKSLRKIDLFIKEVEFVVLEWRIIRFLRAIGDVRINMGKQSITEFVDWASRYTGLTKNLIFDQIFLFQENPGYAPCYSIAGQALREIQKKAKNLLKLNTIASSFGFPPRTIFERNLKEIA